MEFLFNYFISHPDIFWISLGCLLLAAEMLGAGGYLLWCSISAFIVGIITWIFPAASWEWMGAIFALLMVSTAYLWWYWLRHRMRQCEMPVTQLNRRQQQLIGCRAVLTEDIKNGMGRLDVLGSSWRIEAAMDYSAGTHVQVTAVNGVTLTVSEFKR